jgi:hypothetical protein
LPRRPRECWWGGGGGIRFFAAPILDHAKQSIWCPVAREDFAALVMREDSNVVLIYSSNVQSLPALHV